MKGRIKSRQKCKCGIAAWRDNGFTACVCDECGRKATDQFYVDFKVNKRERIKKSGFGTYKEAGQFLSFLRWQTSTDQLDIREFKKERPLSFRKLAFQWLEAKERNAERKHYNNLVNTMQRAITAWGDTSIKEIGYAELEDFLLSQKRMNGTGEISEKTRNGYKCALHDFWTWLRKRRVIQHNEFPEFPSVPYELGFGKILKKEDQSGVVEEVKRLTGHLDPKIWVGIRWLRNYPIVRPGELREIKEGDINLEQGIIAVPHPKEKRPKYIELIDEDIELAQQLMQEYPGFSEQPFFRHPRKLNRAAEGSQYGKHYWAKWWNRACQNLGITGVPLYRGTKHSTVSALGDHFTPEQIKMATGHSTNRAFERYYRRDSRDRKLIYAVANCGDNMVGFKKAEEKK
jgi:integrase